MKKLGFFAILIVALPLLVASCVFVEVASVETDYETEYRTEYKTETYTETVDAVVASQEGRTYLNPVVKWYTNVLLSEFGGAGGTYYYGYWIDPTGHSKARVEIRISPSGQLQKGVVRVYDLTGIGQIPPRPTPFDRRWYEPSELSWLYDLNYVLSSAPVLGEMQTGVGMDDYIIFDADVVREFGIFATTWNAYTIGSVKLVWVDETMGKKTVTLEKQVPYQVPYQVEKQRTVTRIEKVPFWQAIFGG